MKYVNNKYQNGGGDIIGNIGDHEEPFAQRPADFGEVQPAHIALDDGQVVKGIRGRAQEGQHVAVHLHGKDHCPREVMQGAR